MLFFMHELSTGVSSLQAEQMRMAATSFFTACKGFGPSDPLDHKTSQ